MKKISLLFFAFIVMAGTSFAQTKKASWPEMKSFHSLMSATFHPTEEGNYKPLILMADSMYAAAKIWQSSAIPANFKPTETKQALQELVTYCQDIVTEVKAGAAENKLKEMIVKAHDTFHKLAGECKKED